MRTSTSIPRMYADDRGLKHGELTNRLIGIFFDIYNELGHVFLESVYEQTFAIALAENDIFFKGKWQFLFGTTSDRLGISGPTSWLRAR